MKIPDSRTLSFAATLVALTMAPAASAATPVYREIKDWVVACDNTARCEAIGMQEAYPQLRKLNPKMILQEQQSVFSLVQQVTLMHLIMRKMVLQ